MTNKSLAYICLSASTILLGAFLLFQVQPVISKMILPWFGGGPAVWTACMLFFQVLLLGGYAYAHLLASGQRSIVPTLLHLGLLVAALFTLPITPDATWKPPDGTRPTWNILVLLSANVGLPYFLLSATGPLVQAWFTRVFPGRSPYRLYALSNVGSLGALITYPFLFEPWLTTGAQGSLWSVLFGVFALLCAGLAIATHRTGVRAIGAADPDSVSQSSSDSAVAAGAECHPPAVPPQPSSEISLSLDRRLAWLFLPALASMMLLAVTNHVCQDVAVVPFLWVIPLSLYLLSFILCFDSAWWYRRRVFGIAATLSLVCLCYLLAEDAVEVALESVCGLLAMPVGWVNREWSAWLSEVVIEFDWDELLDELQYEAGGYLLVLFLVCMVCHGELVRLKPPPAKLTAFYLMVAAGGALGGIFVALVGPQIFSTHLEMSVGLVASFMIALGVVWDDFWQTWLLNHVWKRCLAFLLGFFLLMIVVRAQFEALNSGGLFSVRNFYGVLTVEEHYEDDPDYHIRQLMNGRILHGSQFLDPQKRRLPTTYYNFESGIGITLSNLSRGGPLRVAVVGLGTGTIAAYGVPGDYYCFYEINPNVQALANQHFSYLRDTPAEVKVRLGDARISLERQPPQRYDVIALDAFSGDAIPAHLLTIEAFDLYLRHLASDGVIAVHISNRHLDLIPVVGGLAKHFELPAVLIDYQDEDYIGEAGSDWVLLTRSSAFLRMPDVARVARPLGEYEQIPLWTDQYSNLLQIIR